MQSFFSVDEQAKLSPKTNVDSPTTVTHSYSPVDPITQIEIYVRENFSKIIELGSLLLKRYPNLIKTIETSYLEKYNRTQAKINSLLVDMNHHNQLLHLHQHLRDAHRHYILEFLGRNVKDIQNNMHTLMYPKYMISRYIEKNSEYLNEIEKDILNQPYEFRVWLFNILKKELESKASLSAGYENAQLKEYLSSSLDGSLGMREHYTRLLSSKMRKASEEVQTYQQCANDLLAKQLRDFSTFRVNVFEKLKAKYESIAMLQFEFSLYREEVLQCAKLSQELLENVRFMQSYFDYTTQFDFISPLGDSPQPQIPTAESEGEDEWFFADISPNFSMMLMETATHGIFIDNDIFAYFVARQLHEPNPPRHRVCMEQRIIQVVHGIEDQFTNFRIVS